MKTDNENQFAVMTETPVSRLVIRLGIPTTISMLVTNIYNMADTYFVSKIGTSASGAVGVVFGLMAVLQAVGFMLGHGSGSIISRRLGAKNPDSASETASTGFFLSLGFGTVIGILGIIFINPFMLLLGSTPTILPFARQYAVFILVAAPFMTSSFVLNNILRYEGKASYAMVGLVTGAVLNIFGDWLLMERFGLGIEGAGISTAVSQFISFLILLSIFLTGKTTSKLSLKNFTRKFSVVAEIMSTGFPSLMRQGLSSVSTMVLNSLAGGYGDAAVAAMTIVNRICFFIFAVGLGIGQGFQPVSAFNYGAKKYSRVKKSFFFTLITGEILLSVLAIVGMLLSDRLIGFFRDDSEVILIGTFALRVQLLSLFFHPLCVCSNMLFQSIGKNRSASFLSTLRSGLVFIPSIVILSHLLGLTGIEIAQTVSDIISFFITIPFTAVFFKRLGKETESEITQ